MTNPVRYAAARTPLLRSPAFWLSLGAGAAWCGLGLWLLLRFFRTDSPSASRLAAFILWPGQLFDFHTPAVPLPGARVFLFALAVLVYYLLLLFPWWLPRLATSRLRPILGFALIAVHLVASLPISAHTRLLFDLARAVREL